MPSPQYALGEVRHWQSNPESHSLPLCPTDAVGNCTGDPSSEASQVQGAMAERQSDLSSLQSLSTGTLPDGTELVNDLIAAMQASDKATFVDLWDPVAASLGLTQYDQGQI